MHRYLNPGEKIIKEFGIAPRYLNTLIITGIITSFFILGLFILASALYKKYAIWYILTDKKILLEKGLLNKRVTSVNLSKVTDIGLEQSWVNRVAFHMGTLEVNTAGSEGYELKLKNIEQPYTIKRLVEKHME